MNTFKNIGLIMCGDVSKKSFHLTGVSHNKGYVVKKVLVKEGMSERLMKLNYPDAEMVADKNNILQDNDLDLLIVSVPANTNSDLIGEVLRSGKPVRVVSQV